MVPCSRRSILIALSGAAIFTAGGATFLVPTTAPVPQQRLALRGYDPVSYFTEGHPELGSGEYSASYDGATYWFRSAEHRALFVADPDHYAPQFRGYCTNTLSHGTKYEADPEAWVIAGGRLYVFGSKAGVPVFRRQTAAIIAKATANWVRLRSSP